MGGKNDAPEAPDYSALAKASEKSAKYSYELAKEQQAWAKQVYGDNKMVSDIVVDKALGALDRQEADAARDRERYESIYQPLEEQLAYDAENYASQQEQEYQAGKAEADVASQFEQARNTAAERLEQFGMDPTQLRRGALDLGTRVAEAAAQASAGNQTRQAVKDRGMALRDQAINVGKGYPAQIGAAQAGAGQAGNQAVNTGLATTASGAQTMGTGQGWQGLGNQAVQGWGNILNSQYQNQLAQFQANQNASSGWGDILGTGLGFATKFMPGFAEGGVIPEEEGAMLPPEMSPSAGAIPDDIPAEIEGGGPARLNAGEFIVPQDVVKWLGEKGMQQVILKARKEMTGANGERPAQPETKPAPAPYESAGAIPMPAGA